LIAIVCGAEKSLRRIAKKINGTDMVFDCLDCDCLSRLIMISLMELQAAREIIIRDYSHYAIIL
jgi:hypothetical protein